MFRYLTIMAYDYEAHNIGKAIHCSWILAFLLLIVSCQSEENHYKTWKAYRGGFASNSYSSLDQINRENVGNLDVAWVYHSEDKDNVKWKKSTSECNPIIVDGTMYLTSPAIKVIALNAATGEETWRFDPFAGDKAVGVNRGVAYWEDGEDKRILFSAGFYLYALNAETGSVISSFGDSGKVDLREGLGRNPEELYVVASSPGIVYEDLLIMGSSVGEGRGAAPGHIRAYDVRTGEQEWIFHTIPHPGEFGYKTWPKDAWKRAGGANSWAGMSLDKERGIVFASTGSPSPQLIGVGRPGKNLFANSIIALDAATGEYIWHYQVVHHDLWDYDLPAPPNLVTVGHDGEMVDAVAQVTKHGFIFLLNRETGEPLFPIEERLVPASNIAGEVSWPTQPFPVKPEPFTRQKITREDLTNVSPEAHKYALKRFRELRYKGLFTPIGEQETLFYPGTQGGAEWGGASFDPETGMLYVNANEFGYIFSLKKVKRTLIKNAADVGERIFQLNCAVCHGSSGSKKSSLFPSLTDIEERLLQSKVKEIISKGRGRMPGFPQLSEEEKDAIVVYLFNLGETEKSIDIQEVQIKEESYQYSVDTAYELFKDQNGYPATKPPWGTLNAINMNTGELVWKVPLGKYPEFTEEGIPPTGTHNLGGSIVTAGGLVFIGATKDDKFRAFDKQTGEVLWEYQLLAGGYATPSTYKVDGKQYVVIAATGGGNMGTKTGDAFIAFSLP